MEKENEIIFRTLKWLNYLYSNLGDGSHKAFFEKAKFLQGIKNIQLPNTDAAAIRILLEDAKIQKIKENIYKILHPGVEIANVSFEEIEKVSLFDLSDTQLVNYFGLYCLSVMYIHKDNLVLMKYGPKVHEIGWNKLALVCRGKVIDVEKEIIVSYPYDKFFNLNETPDYSEGLIEKLMCEAADICITDKKDGSLIAVTRLSDIDEDFLITTNGSFNNMHTALARKMIDEKYPEFKKSAPSGITFIFEIIHPEDPHCIAYGDIKKMYLHGARRLDNYQLVRYEELKRIAERYNLDIVEREYLDLATMTEKAKEKDVNKEGWVVRIVSPDGSDKIVKIKYDEYFILHRKKAGVNIRKIYNRYVFVKDIQDALPDMLPDIREAVLGVIEEININRQKIKAKVIAEAKKITESLGIPTTNISREEKRKLYEATKGIKREKEKYLIALVLKYVSYGNIDWDIEYLRFDKYEKLTREEEKENENFVRRRKSEKESEKVSYY